MAYQIPRQVSATEAFFEVGGTRLSYWDTGGDGAPIVLCHPASQCSRIWSHQQPALAAAGYRVIAYSRRGHGLSPRGPDNDPGTLVGDLRQLFEHLRLADAHLLGAAAGGIVAMGFAVAFPERVRSLVLAGTIVSPQEEDWRVLYRRLAIAEVRAHVPTEFLELGPAYRASRPDGTAAFVDLEHGSKPAGAMAQPVGANVTWQAMEQLTVPVLLVTGEADLFAPPPLQDLIAGHLRCRDVVTMPAIGHAPYWEAPDDFNRIVLEFLARRSFAR